MILLAALIVAARDRVGGLAVAGELRAARDGAGTARSGGDAADAVRARARRHAAGSARVSRVAADRGGRAPAVSRRSSRALDRATGGTFPFSPEQIEAAHAQWTADWLAWELAHDTEYKLKAAIAEQELDGDRRGGPRRAARLDAIEREKLDLYQRRYADYVRTAKALQALIAP